MDSQEPLDDIHKKLNNVATKKDINLFFNKLSAVQTSCTAYTGAAIIALVTFATGYVFHNKIENNIDAANAHLSDGSSYYQEVNKEATNKALKWELARAAFNSPIGADLPEHITINTKPAKTIAQKAGDSAEQKAREKDQKYAEKSVWQAVEDHHMLEASIFGSIASFLIMIFGTVGYQKQRQATKFKQELNAKRQNNPEPQNQL